MSDEQPDPCAGTGHEYHVIRVETNANPAGHPIAVVCNECGTQWDVTTNQPVEQRVTIHIDQAAAQGIARAIRLAHRTIGRPRPRGLDTAAGW